MDSAWYGHVPFAGWMVRAARPRVIVELGTHAGVSYAAFCEAVLQEGLDARCYAIDTWQGDEHAGFYDEAVFEELREFHDARYAGFSRLIRCAFDAALPQIADNSVDLLHIDGRHRYDDVAPTISQAGRQSSRPGRSSCSTTPTSASATSACGGGGRNCGRSFPASSSCTRTGWGCWRSAGRFLSR